MLTGGCLALFFLVPAFPLRGQVYFLSPLGNDGNPGSREQPVKSLQKGVSLLKAGDTLVLTKGVHRLDGIVKTGLKGTRERPVVIRGEEGALLKGGWDKSKVKGHGPTEKCGIQVHKCSWLTISGLEVSHAGGGVFMVAWTSHVTLKDLHIHDYSNYGIISADSRDLLIENCNIHGSLIEHGIYLTSRNSGVTVRGCEFHDTAINGLHINSPENRNILVENCIFHHNSRDWGACITLMGTKDSVIGNNIFYCNLGHIFTITGGASGISILNNTMYQPHGGRNGRVFLVRTPLRSFEVKRNIIFTNAKAVDADQESHFTEDTDFNFNVYGSMSGRQTPQYEQDANSIFGASVRFVRAPGWKDRQCVLMPAGGVPAGVGAQVDRRGRPFTPESRHEPGGGAGVMR